MRQRLYCRVADEGRDFRIGNIDLISMCLEITKNKCVGIPLESVDILGPSSMWDLLGKYAMKLWIDAVSVDRNRHEFAHRSLDGIPRYLDQSVADHLQQVAPMPLNDSCYQGFFAGKVLVERADAYAGYGGNFVGTCLVVALLN